MRTYTKITCGIAAMTLLAASSYAAGINPSDVVVVRVGDGGAALSGNTAPVFLDEYTQSGAFVQSIPMPTSQVGGSLALTMGGVGIEVGGWAIASGSRNTPPAIKDATTIFGELRRVKSQRELDILQHAVDITAEAFQRAYAFAVPGAWEYEIQAQFEKKLKEAKRRQDVVEQEFEAARERSNV